LPPFSGSKKKPSKKLNESSSKQGFLPISCLRHAGFLLGLLFDPEDGGNIFLRNTSWLSPEY
jgi:hypothetical protein